MAERAALAANLRGEKRALLPARCHRRKAKGTAEEPHQPLALGRPANRVSTEAQLAKLVERDRSPLTPRLLFRRRPLAHDRRLPEGADINRRGLCKRRQDGIPRARVNHFEA